MQLLILLALAASCGALAQSTPPPGLDQWVERTMQRFEVPGLALAVIKDGHVVHSRGYGVRNRNAPEKVDEQTLFGIASNSKAFTAAALAILVDEGKLAWDDPVQKHLPWFQMKDPFVTRELTVRDTLSHRSGLGLGAGDLMFWPDTDVTRREVVAGARHLPPASSLRSRYAYNNLMFVVAGEIVAAVSGRSWDDFVRQRILEPLGMSQTRTCAEGLSSTSDNVAVPHSRGWRLQGTLTPIHPTRDCTWAAAAGLRSNITDLSRWVLAHLNGGKSNDKQLWTEAAARQMWAPQTIIPISEPSEPLKALKANFAAYGLGWTLRDYRGRKIVSHGGALTGMLSTVYLIPEEKLGIIVLTNQEESGAFSSIVYHIVDHYLSAPPTDWIEAYTKSRDEMFRKAAEAEQKQVAARAPSSQPSLDLADYAGEYQDAWYGKCILTLHNGALSITMSRTPAMTGRLEHWQHNTFRAVWNDKTIPDAFVTFSLNHEGKIQKMELVATSTLADFSFDYHDLDFRPVPKR
jgi:CubicO group peptidase (beta-lactamase class C family)